ncbi:hypothetical protein HOLleu_14963 [Holothuria leucospilota]|uniref:Uncharacterized protein n=1 Tax=Holothuria leucospilota TaxID=206669 RepID=A0A9Q1HC43_HOLLE|nr:hypothetical protein HOLleu_14963 [Holothuria leucospilota]
MAERAVQTNKNILKRVKHDKKTHICHYWIFEILPREKQDTLRRDRWEGGQKPSFHQNHHC